MTLVTLLLLLSPVAPSRDFETLGDSLFASGAHAAAATEYRRALFMAPGDDSTTTRLKLGLSLGLAGEIDASGRILTGGDRFDEAGRYAAGTAFAGILVAGGRLEEARIELLDLRFGVRDSERVRAVERHIGWLDARLGAPADAAASFERAGATAAAARARAAAGLSRKNPGTAVLLSSFLPGAGEIYAGRAGAGLHSLAVNAATVGGIVATARSDDWLASTILFTLVFLRFYAGSRSNAARFAEEYNRSQVRRALAPVAGDPALLPDWFGEIGRQTGLKPEASPSSPDTAGRLVPRPARRE